MRTLKVIIQGPNGEERELFLDEDAVSALEQIAAVNGLTIENALRQALANEQFLEGLESSGATLLVKQDDVLRELVRKPLVAA
jgi:hypothetical protein